MSKEWGHFCELLRRICSMWGFRRHNYSRAEETKQSTSKLIDLYEDVVDQLQGFEPVDATRVKGLIDTSSDEINLISESIVVFLKPPSLKGLGRRQFPVLTVWASNMNGDLRAKIVLAFFTHDDSESVRCAAYRYETVGEGRHEYAHVQLVNRWSSSDAENILGVSQWRPDQTPAFPLDAKTAVQVLLCMIVSIYGLGALEDLADYEIYRHVNSELAQMHLNSPGDE